MVWVVLKFRDDDENGDSLVWYIMPQNVTMVTKQYMHMLGHYNSGQDFNKDSAG